MHNGIVVVTNMKSIMLWTSVLLAALFSSSVRADQGTQVDIYDYPSLAQVEVRVGLVWVQQCVASVLTSRHVLSVATCFSGSLYIPENRQIRVGTSQRGVGGQVVNILREYNHPNFGLLGHDSDISVIRLDTALTLGDNVKQVAILGEGIYLPDGLRLQLIGWGTTAQGSVSADSNLYSIDLYTHNYERCGSKYFQLEEPEDITENMICAGFYDAGGRDLDNRDIGAPLFYDNVIVGAVSFGRAYADNTIPLVSTAVASFTGWIVKTATY